jgi:pyruvate/2-oxoglutarate dehydrogenase complex dihydrolipoamide dehydrogenase (E3) component
MPLIKTDICVIGAGSGGLSVAAGAAQMGADVVLLEGGKMGGDCLNYGCVPSKSLLHAAQSGMNFADALAHAQTAIQTIAPHDSQTRFEGLGVRVIREYGHFTGPGEIAAGPHRIRARRFVIATGSRPFIPLINGLESVPYMTNETLFTPRPRPDHLLIIGGGPIGMEMAQAHIRLGCQVTVLQAGKALPMDDPDHAAIVLRQLRQEGATVIEGFHAYEITHNSNRITIHAQDGRNATGTHLLIAAGRRANIDSLNLHAAGIQHDRLITVNQSLKTTNHRVYAIGDCASPLQFTHMAGYQAGIIVRSALFALPAKARTDHIPWATYTSPELAQIGLTQAQAGEKYGAKLIVAQASLADNDRAITEGGKAGEIKVMIAHNRPVGVSIVAANAGEMIQFWSLAIANRLKMSQLAAHIAPYPTLGELNKAAISAYYRPKLFDRPMVKRVVKTIQRVFP